MSDNGGARDQSSPSNATVSALSPQTAIASSTDLSVGGGPANQTADKVSLCFRIFWRNDPQS